MDANKIRKTAVAQAVEKAGGKQAFAEKLGVSLESVRLWSRGHPMTPNNALGIERLTGVKRRKLLPELFGPVR